MSLKIHLKIHEKTNPEYKNKTDNEIEDMILEEVHHLTDDIVKKYVDCGRACARP